MRRKDDTLRETLLATARAMVAADGPEAISIRRLADGACVATGTVYNYFTGKEDVLFTLTEDYWRKAFTVMQTGLDAPDFVGQIGQIYAFICSRMDDSVGALMRSLRGASPEGRARMLATQKLLCGALVRRLDADTQISPDLWTSLLTREAFADFVILNLFSNLTHQADSIAVFLDILKRVLYAPEGGTPNGTGNF